jgi:hypothetical protein
VADSSRQRSLRPRPGHAKKGKGTKHRERVHASHHNRFLAWMSGRAHPKPPKNIFRVKERQAKMRNSNPLYGCSVSKSVVWVLSARDGPRGASKESNDRAFCTGNERWVPHSSPVFGLEWDAQHSFCGCFDFPRAGWQNGKWHIESRHPTQAKERLEWGLA